MSHFFTPTRFVQFIVFYFALLPAGFAQLPVCSGPGSGLIYYLGSGGIYNYNPALPISGTNPVLNTIAPPSGAAGLCVSQNINGAGPSPTFYTTIGTYYYYNGSTWINTGHTAGAVNPGAGGGFIYNLNGTSGEVYKYDGTGNATLLTTVTTFMGGGPFDIQGDCSGGFYLLRTATPQNMQLFSSTGALLQTWTSSGAPSAGSGGGFGIIGNTVIYNNTSGLVIGTITGSNINFNVVQATGLPNSVSDFASCQVGASAPSVKDTAYYCGNGSGVTLTAQGSSGPYNWTVVSGPATITGSGSSVVVNTTATSVIARNNTSGGCGGTYSVDTTLIRVPTASLNAGPDHTIRGCGGNVADILGASITGTTPGINYMFAWTPAATITANGTTLTPSISTNTNTTYTITATTSPGGCIFKDSVKVSVIDDHVTAGFNSIIHYGCDADTVLFTNTSTNATFYTWDFGNGTFSTLFSPTHVFPVQANQSVELLAYNATCRDSVTKNIDTQHPLIASFTVDHDSACVQQTINFTNTSVTTTMNSIPPQYFWDFGDGTTSTFQSTPHIYTNPGIYTARLVVQDFVPCFDTFYKTIVVDTLPFVSFAISDSLLCEGQRIDFLGSYFTEGLSSIVWNFGDGGISNVGGTVSHAYDTSGIFTVSLTGNYRLCPNVMTSRQLTIKPYPMINIGADTFLCPNGQPIRLADNINAANPLANYLWNTGATTSSILVNTTGTFWANVSVDGCSNTDSVTVFKDCYVNMPNSFSPNGDGMNDYFFPRDLLSRSATMFKMSVYNRWGQLIFETNSIDGRGWDGKFNDVPQSQGVYIYIMDIAFTNGVKEHYQGNVTLLR